MDSRADISEARPILALVYADGYVADRLIANLGYRLREAGVAVAGIVQHNTFIRDRTRCDMEVEELASGTVLQLSEYRGSGARGCRLDRAALCKAAALLAAAIAENPRLLVLNKFGKTEAEGQGLRGALAEAVQCGIPIIVGVPFRSLDQWRVFAADLAEECPVESPRVPQWLSARGFFPDGESVSAGDAVRGS